MSIIGVLVAKEGAGGGWLVIPLEHYLLELPRVAEPPHGPQKFSGTMTGRVVCHSTLSDLQRLAYCVLTSEADAKGPFLDEAQDCLKARPDAAACPLRRALRSIISLLDGDSVPHPDSEAIRIAREALDT